MVNICWFKLAEKRGNVFGLGACGSGFRMGGFGNPVGGFRMIVEKCGNSSATKVAAVGLSQLVWNF
jgi:hypothetical protein